MKRGCSIVLPLILLAAFAPAAGKNDRYVPVTTGMYDKDGWDISKIVVPPIDGKFAPPFNNIEINYFSIDVAASLGLHVGEISAKGSFSYLVVERNRCFTEAIELEVTTTKDQKTAPYTVKAAFGTACRLGVLVAGGSLDAALDLRGGKIGASVSIAQESLTFNSIGFTQNVPFELATDNSGKIDLSSAKKELFKVFNLSSNDDKCVSVQLIGFYLPMGFPDLKDVSKVKYIPKKP